MKLKEHLKSKRSWTIVAMGLLEIFRALAGK